MLTIRDDRQLRSLTGVSDKVLAELETEFTKVYQKHQEQVYEQGLAKGTRQRKPGGGRKCVLDTMNAKLCLILYYLKTYPTFDVLAEKVNLSRSNVHRHVHKLIPLLSATLAALGYLPKRNFETVEEFKVACEGISSILIDVTERECSRPKNELEQKEHYSGKQGYHTIKNTVMASPEKVILFIGSTFSGRQHDYAMFKQEFPPEESWFETINAKVDLGYQGIKTDYPDSNIDIPFKKPRKSKNNPKPLLSAEQKDYNRVVSQARIYVENAIGGMKRFNILVQRFRNRILGFVDDVIAICAGLWNALIC